MQSRSIAAECYLAARTALISWAKSKTMPETLSHLNEMTSRGTVAYVLRSFPRLSELFIASEIYRLEQAGVRLRIYVIRTPEDEKRHEVIDRIAAKPEYLPPTTSLSVTPLHRWLVQHLPSYLPGLWHCIVRHPFGLARAAWLILVQAMRARPSLWSFPRKENLKDFLHATAVADLLLRAPDVRHLHAHFCHAATTVTWLASIITGIPFSFTAHAKDIYCEELNPAGFLRRKMDAARFVVTCTEANRQHLQQLSKTKVHCIYHGLNVDLSLLLEEPSTLTARNGRLCALAVGRLVAKKGFDVFVDACGALKRRGVDFEATIVGPRDERDTAPETEIKKRIAKHGLDDHVKLVGPITQRALLEQYRSATALCLPCRVLENGDRDGIPNVLIEAMACGLPVVSTAVSGIPEIVTDNQSGLLVPPDDAEALAEALLRLHRDPVLALQLSHEGRKTVRERFDGQEFARQLADLFREVMQ